MTTIDRVEDPGTLDEDDGVIAVERDGAIDSQLGHRWDKAAKRPKRGPHIATYPAMLPSNEEELERCLADPEWRLFSGCLYQIIVKGDPSKDENGNILDEGDSFVMPFKPNSAQRRFIRRLWHRNLILKARQLGFCVSPDTRVLTAELKWVRIEDVQEGQEVVAVDENPPGGRGSSRKMRTATVQRVARVHRTAHRITFDDGREVVCTDRHPWLSRKVATDAKWRSISGEGNAVTGRLKVGTQVRWITKPWNDDPTYEDGWFGGILDGEGSMALASRAGANVCAAQREGDVLARMVSYAESNGYSYRIEEDKATERPGKFGKQKVPKVVFSRMDELFRLIGTTRPSRFIGRRFWEGKELPGKRNGDVGWATITKIELLGEQTMIDMQTSTGTYIAEGFVSHNTTLIAIMWLDHALFNGNQRCGMIAQDRETAESIFRDKIVFAYDHLPEEIRERFPLSRASTKELLFAHNNSSIRVATSVRGGTIHRLHVSEFGTICAKSPQKAVEVVTGSIPAVPTSGILVIESTAEGREGDFFKMVQVAEANQASRHKLTPRDYRMHFYAWWQEPKYRLEASSVSISREEHEYFDLVEATVLRDLGERITIDPDQRAWYVATKRADFSGAEEKMWQQYPSFPAEAFQVSTEGNYYAKDMAALRKRGGITRVPELDLPVNTFWDIGNSDGCAIWFHQELGGEDRFIGYYEAHNETLQHYVSKMRERGHVFGRHFLPHDANHKRLSDHNRSTKEMLEALMPGERFEVVPIITDLMTGVQMVRKHMRGCFIDEAECKKGIARLDGYRKRFSQQDNRFTDQPDKSNGCTEGADAFRQWAQAKENGALRLSAINNKTSKKQPATDWRIA